MLLLGFVPISAKLLRFFSFPLQIKRNFCFAFYASDLMHLVAFFKLISAAKALGRRGWGSPPLRCYTHKSQVHR